ncbi:MAG TPA: cytochrome c [Gallionellaceae bacterium]
MKHMSIAAALLALFLMGSAHAAPFPKGDAEAGKKFFTQNNCNRCHDGIMGGDGNKIFTRPNRKVSDPQQLVAQLRRCSGGAGITMTAQDEQNLGAYLSREYYHFK